MSDVVKIGQRAKPPVHYGTSANPNNRAPFAKAVVAVTSGKGGVGKSTVVTNLAVGCAQRGLRVGILDADVYGPSLPRMLSLHGEHLEWNDNNQMVPAQNYGVRLVSTGLTTPELDTPLAWRSAVATSAIVQLLDDVAWGPLDLLFVDMPPGTGDVQITLAQEVPLCLAVVVTTPQTVATDDVARSIRMLQDIKVPTAVVENMSFFRAPDTGQIYHPFGEGGGLRLCEQYGLPLLGRLELTSQILSKADAGQPIIAVGNREERAPWAELVDRLLEQPSLQTRLSTPNPEPDGSHQSGTL